MEAVNPLLAEGLRHLKQGNAEQAEREFARAAAACCSAFGENDIVTARTLAHLARLCVSGGKLDIAVPMYERIVRIHEALPELCNADHALALIDLANLRADGAAVGTGGAGGGDTVDTLRRKADEIMRDVGARMVERNEHATTRSRNVVEDGEQEDLEDDEYSSSGSSDAEESSGSACDSSSDEDDDHSAARANEE